MLTSVPSRKTLWRAALAVLCAIPASPAIAQGVNVRTYHNDEARTGQNLNEKILNPALVRTNFGKLRTLPVDGDVYAQPLFLSGVTMSDAAGVVTTHDVVYVATQNDSVYAFDADSRTQLQFISLLADPGATAITVDSSGAPFRNADMVPKVGIVGTPVIAVDPVDVSKSTIYVVSKYQVVSGGITTYVQRLNALDAANLKHRPGSPSAPIQATYPGQGNGNDGVAAPGNLGDNNGHGMIVFDPLRANQRAGLLLLNGLVYVCWASHGDQIPYHGWVIGFDGASLKQVAVFNTTPNGGHAGIWHAGAAPAADSRGFIYLATGNGTFDGQWDKTTGALAAGTLDANGFPANGNYGDSVLKLVLDLPNGRLKVFDYFTPYKQNVLKKNDLDQGAGGIILLPDRTDPPQHRMVTASKDGVMYLLNCDDLGKFTAPGVPNPVLAPDRVFQRIPANAQAASPIGLKYGIGAYFSDSIYFVATPLGFWQGNTSGPAINDTFKRFAVAGDLINPTPVSRSTRTFPTHPDMQYPFYMNSPSVSADGASNAIVWMVETDGYQPNLATNPRTGMPNRPAVLFAYDATDLGTELYNSDAAPGGSDQPGLGIKFTTPTIANGKVYFGVSGGVAVYGRLRP